MITTTSSQMKQRRRWIRKSTTGGTPATFEVMDERRVLCEACAIEYAKSSSEAREIFPARGQNDWITDEAVLERF